MLEGEAKGGKKKKGMLGEKSLAIRLRSVRSEHCLINVTSWLKEREESSRMKRKGEEGKRRFFWS